MKKVSLVEAISNVIEERKNRRTNEPNRVYIQYSCNAKKRDDTMEELCQTENGKKIVQCIHNVNI